MTKVVENGKYSLIDDDNELVPRTLWTDEYKDTYSTQRLEAH